MRLKIRCVDLTTNNVKIVDNIIIGNSMLNYASDALNGVEVIGREELAVASSGGVR